MVDGFSEALHEALAGNTIFTEGVYNYLTQTWSQLPEKYPLIEKIFSDLRNPFAMPTCNFHLFFDGGRRLPRLHAPETLACPTGIPIYEIWKQVTIDLFGVGPLIQQVEFYNKEA
jgi:hypothetical protein